MGSTVPLLATGTFEDRRAIWGLKLIFCSLQQWPLQQQRWSLVDVRLMPEVQQKRAWNDYLYYNKTAPLMNDNIDTDQILPSNS